MGGFQGGITHQGGISVYASGFMVGPKLSESFMGPAGADGLIRWDATAVTISTTGIGNGVSTRLSSIIFATGVFKGQTNCSGQNTLYFNWSGNAFDVTAVTGTGTVCTSALISVLTAGK